MRRIDEAVISRFVPGITLMERAGEGIFDVIEEYLEPLDELSVSIFLGRGNNAGDGLVVARLLAERETRVMLHYLHDPKEFSPDAFKNFAKLKRFRKNSTIEEYYLYLGDWKKKVSEVLADTDLVIDALLGTGITKPVKGRYAEVIDLMNDSGLLVLSVDIPSGVNSRTGEVMGTAVRADMTVTMGLPKVGSFFYPGKACTGGFRVVDIGIPEHVIEAEGLDLFISDSGQALEDLPERDPEAHKFRCGSLLLVAGSRRYTGAAHLAAVSALRTGCGIVYLAGPDSIRPVIQTLAPEIIFLPQPETESGSISPSALDGLLGEVRFDALALGPGMTTEAQTEELVRELVRRVEKPILIDADGINAFEGRYGELADHSSDKDMIISPHSGELERLTGTAVKGQPLERIETLRSLVGGTGITLVHKGAPTVIAQPDGRCFINAGGHPGQATAGSGDVLTGAIGGFLAQGCSTAAAARVGVYLHSRAARIAAEDFSERGMVATDCVYALGHAMSELEDDYRYW